MAVRVTLADVDSLATVVTDIKNEGGRILDITVAAFKFNRKTSTNIVVSYRVVSQH